MNRVGFNIRKTLHKLISYAYIHNHCVTMYVEVDQSSILLNLNVGSSHNLRNTPRRSQKLKKMRFLMDVCLAPKNVGYPENSHFHLFNGSSKSKY